MYEAFSEWNWSNALEIATAYIYVCVLMVKKKHFNFQSDKGSSVRTTLFSSLGIWVLKIHRIISFLKLNLIEKNTVKKSNRFETIRNLIIFEFHSQLFQWTAPKHYSNNAQFASTMHEKSILILRIGEPFAFGSESSAFVLFFAMLSWHKKCTENGILRKMVPSVKNARLEFVMWKVFVHVMCRAGQRSTAIVYNA